MPVSSYYRKSERHCTSIVEAHTLKQCWCINFYRAFLPRSYSTISLNILSEISCLLTPPTPIFPFSLIYVGKKPYRLNNMKSLWSISATSSRTMWKSKSSHQLSNELSNNQSQTHKSIKIWFNYAWETI